MKTQNISVSKAFTNSALLEKKYVKTLKLIDHVMTNLSEGKISFDYGGRPIKAAPADIVRVISQIKTSDDLQLCYKNILLNAVISLEMSSSFSSIVFLDMITGKYTKEKRSLCRRGTESNLLEIVRKNLGTGLCYEIFKTIYKSGSLFSDISFKTDDFARTFKVHIEGGRCLEANHHMLFEEKVSVSENCYVLFVDGIIEKVSEIHRLLESAEQENIVLFAHGFSADVVHTLSENFKTKKLQVIPIEVKDKQNAWQFFEETEMSTIRAENYLSIKTTSIDDLSFVKKVLFQNNTCTFIGKESEKASVSVIIPSHFRNQSAVIEERVKAAVQCGQEISKSGVVLNEDGTLFCGWKQYEKSIGSIKATKDLIKNIGCIVTHSE